MIPHLFLSICFGFVWVQPQQSNCAWYYPAAVMWHPQKHTKILYRSYYILFCAYPCCSTHKMHQEPLKLNNTTSIAFCVCLTLFPQKMGDPAPLFLPICFRFVCALFPHYERAIPHPFFYPYVLGLCVYIVSPLWKGDPVFSLYVLGLCDPDDVATAPWYHPAAVMWHPQKHTKIWTGHITYRHVSADLSCCPALVRGGGMGRLVAAVAVVSGSLPVLLGGGGGGTIRGSGGGGVRWHTALKSAGDDGGGRGASALRPNALGDYTQQ